MVVSKMKGLLATFTMALINWKLYY